jgi:hypothetical protein
MNLGDHSPPTCPSSGEQRDAFHKGLGRAWQWALNGRLDDELLLETCLRDQRFDTQCEESRANWLWRILVAAGATRRLRVPILHALHELSDERSANQLCELAGRYAGMGDEAFRSRLYEIVEQKPFAGSACLGEQEIIALDGEHAFLFTARARGQRLVDKDWEWDDGYLIDQAIDRFGEERVNSLLDASPDPAVSRLRESREREKRRLAAPDSAESRHERMKAVPVEEILRAAEGDTKCYWFRSWGRHAAEADLKAVVQHLWHEREPHVIANLVKVLGARALPEFDARLVELGRHGDEEVRRCAIWALEQNVHPHVRDFALSELRRGTRKPSAVGLFTKNYRPGDERLILEGIECPEDAWGLHSLLMDVIEVLEENPEADPTALGVVSYALTPCSNCRSRAVQVLLQRQAAPGWLEDECRYDCDPDCRKLVND